MEKLKNPLKMNWIIFDAAAETLSQFCMFCWRRSRGKYQKFNFHAIEFLSHQIKWKLLIFSEIALDLKGRKSFAAYCWTFHCCLVYFSVDLASLMSESFYSKPINYSKAFCWYSLANNVLFWQTILHPMHIFGPHWTSFECVMENRRRRQPIPLYSTAIPNFVPWWNDLMNNEWLQLTFKFIPSLSQGLPLFMAIQKRVKN